MTIVTIQFKDPANPQEIQTWFNANPAVSVVAGFIWQNFAYLITNP